MHVGQKNRGFLYNMGSNGLQRVDVEKDLGVMISSDLCVHSNVYMLIIRPIGSRV